MLAHVTGTVDEGLRLRNEYRIAENRILRVDVDGKPRLTDPHPKTLAEIGKQLGRKALAEVATPRRLSGREASMRLTRIPQARPYFCEDSISARYPVPRRVRTPDARAFLPAT